METTRQHLEKVVHAVVRRELQRANTRDEEAVRNAQEVARAMAESADTNLHRHAREWLRAPCHIGSATS